MQNNTYSSIKLFFNIVQCTTSITNLSIINLYNTTIINLQNKNTKEIGILMYNRNHVLLRLLLF